MCEGLHAQGDLAFKYKERQMTFSPACASMEGRSSITRGFFMIVQGYFDRVKTDPHGIFGTVFKMLICYKESTKESKLKLIGTTKECVDMLNRYDKGKNPFKHRNQTIQLLKEKKERGCKDEDNRFNFLFGFY